MFGMLGTLVLRRAPDDLTAVLASVVAAFATSLVTEHFHGSPVIAVVVAGVLIGHEMRARLEPGRVLALQGFWEIAAFVTNVWLFLLVGIQLSADLLLREAWPIALAVIALHVGRAVAVYGCFGALHLAGEGVPWRWQHVMVFGNVKGALSMAAVLALPANIPYRERLVAIVFGVTLITLVTQALPFRAFLTWLGVAGGGEDELAEECRAILIGARRAQAELDSLLASGLLSRHDHAERWAEYQRDIIDAERKLRTVGRGLARARRVARRARRPQGRDPRRGPARPDHRSHRGPARRRDRRTHPAGRHAARPLEDMKDAAMKIVIVGAGRAGLEVATHLTRLGHAITIVDNDELVTRRASEQHGLVALQRRRHDCRGARGGRRPPRPTSSSRCCGATRTTWPSRSSPAPPASSASWSACATTRTGRSTPPRGSIACCPRPT